MSSIVSESVAYVNKIKDLVYICFVLCQQIIVGMLIRNQQVVGSTPIFGSTPSSAPPYPQSQSHGFTLVHSGFVWVCCVFHRP